MSKEYSVNCTGNCVTGDEVMFEKDIFSGSYPKTRWEGTEIIFAKITKDSYGSDKGQHTFSLETLASEKMRIKGRNLYKYSVYRKVWEDEDKRKEALENKYAKSLETKKHIQRMKTNGGCIYD